MQRLARFFVESNNTQAMELFAHYKQIYSLLLKHLPPSTANIFAQPIVVEGNGQKIVEWWTSLQGQPRRVFEEQDEYKIAKTVINQRLRDIERLWYSLSEQSYISDEESNFLKQLVEIGKWKVNQIYLINNEPVITGWGMLKHISPPVTPKEKITITPAPVIKKRVVKKKVVTKKVTSKKRLLLPFGFKKRCLLIPFLFLFGYIWFYIGAPLCIKPPSQINNNTNVVFLFDTSGSMDDRIENGDESILNISKQKANQLIDKLAPLIDIGFVEFSSEARRYGFFKFFQREKLKEKISHLSSNGGTNFDAGLKLALNDFSQDSNGLVLVFSDGDGGDICHYDQEIAERLPKLKVTAFDLGQDREKTFCQNNPNMQIISVKDEKVLDNSLNTLSSSFQCKCDILDKFNLN